MTGAPVFFEEPEAFREWLQIHHATADELVVGHWKRAAGRLSITWSESVDVALCFGWIDGVVRRLDDLSYTRRFTRRRTGSIWSAVNVARFAALEADGLTTDAGRRAFAARHEDRTGVYAHERAEPAELPAGDAARFEAEPAAWAWFCAQPPSYRQQALHWVISAKRDATRERRLVTLIADAAAGQRVAPLRRTYRSVAAQGG